MEKAGIKNETKGFKDRHVIELFLIAFVNVSYLMDYFYTNLGLLIDLVFSIMNYSCAPNCTLIWKDNSKILMKTTLEVNNRVESKLYSNISSQK